MEIQNERILFSEKARNLGIVFDSKLSMNHHISYLCQVLYLEIRRIGKLSKFLNIDSLKTLTSAFVFSRIDYCNSLFANLPIDVLFKIQRFQNQAARLILKCKKTDHVTPMLKQLHWLPVKARILYKIAVLCHKCIHNNAPLYVCDLVQLYEPPRQLRSANNFLLRVPKKGSKKLAGRSFSHFAPSVWNALPQSLRTTSSLIAFKSGLKTHLMQVNL